MEKPNILIVDDNTANLVTLKSVLKSLDVNILTASTGNEALSLLLRNKVAVVLLDVQLPDINGFEVAELMLQNEETCYVPIIFITAFDKDDKYLFKGYEVGAVDYIFKPFDINVVKSKLAVFVKLYNQKAELSKQKNELTEFLKEKERLIEYIETQNAKKDLLINENNEQKKRLNNYFRFKLGVVGASLTGLILLGFIYNAHISLENSQLIAYTKELNNLNNYNIQLNDAYKRFIPYDILNLLNKNSIIDVKLGDQVQKEMIVLFSDVRGYSTIAENLTPQENISLINHILQMMQTPIADHHGIVNKYLGDGLMALFHTSANDALDASIAMLKKLAEFSQKRIENEQTPVRIGVGIDMGEMMVGTVGSEDRMEHTVVADAVNVASRIEGLTKMYGASLLISENIYRNLKDPSQYTIRFVDTVRVKGRQKPVIVYQVFDGECSSTIELHKKTSKDFSEGILLFREKKFSEAQHSFQKVLAVNHEDQAAKIYAKRCEENMHQPIDSDWSYVQTIDIK